MTTWQQLHIVNTPYILLTMYPCVQVREALPWLNSRLEPSEYRRYAAVLVCREMASEAPAVFNVHVKTFLDLIWGGLRDQKLHVREASVQALEVSVAYRLP